ncbi:abortive infection family protein [Microcella sp.]|uniref:abortive infection family protein n=1 Tax=Microcella sp. TaxID=1913979 RepID=UPI003F71395D
MYESVLLEFAAEEGLERFERALGLDGFTIDGNRRIAPAKLDLAGLSGLSALRDADGIREAFRRIELLMDEDPAGVVGASKELIEATAKSIVAAFEEPLMGNEKTPALVARAQALLGLGAGDVTNSIDSAPAVRRVLGGLASIAQGVAELRNAEGGGHGRSARSRLTARHARLAFNSARAWCEIVIDTHADPEAPFRATRTPASGS